MQQTLRRVLRTAPTFLSESPRLYSELVTATAQAEPPIQARGDVVSRQLVPSKNRPLRGAPQFRVPGGRTALAVQPMVTAEDVFGEDVPGALRIEAREVLAPVLPATVLLELEQLASEHSADVDLAGLAPSRTVLLTGQPGTGKTMSAAWIASLVDKPLLVLDLAYVMSHELGRSAHNLREALDWSAGHDVVLFIDEFDAIASSRSLSNDVGEMRRLVNVLLLALDQWPNGNLLIAATNHPELLDRAIERRFDVVVDLPLPNQELRAQVARQVDGELSSVEAEAIATVSEGLSASHIRRAIDRARRQARFAQRAVTLTDRVRNLHSPDIAMAKSDRDRVIKALGVVDGLSARQIAEIVGVSHPTVLNALKDS